MRAVIQRVKQASVTVDEKIVGQISHGMLVFVGITTDDSEEDVAYLTQKLAGLRIFEDPDGKMNCSIEEVRGSMLLVSQFTLYGDCRKGRRPSFIEAARPELAKSLYESMIANVKRLGIPVETGIFQAQMDVALINDGPITLLLDSRKNF